MPIHLLLALSPKEVNSWVYFFLLGLDGAGLPASPILHSPTPWPLWKITLAVHKAFPEPYVATVRKSVFVKVPFVSNI